MWAGGLPEHLPEWSHQLAVTCDLYLGGLFHDFIRSVGEGTNFGGGPLEALLDRLTARLAAPMEDSRRPSSPGFRPGLPLADAACCILPDVERFSLGNYVAEGFNIPDANSVEFHRLDRLPVAVGSAGVY